MAGTNDSYEGTTFGVFWSYVLQLLTLGHVQLSPGHFGETVLIVLILALSRRRPEFVSYR